MAKARPLKKNKIVKVYNDLYTFYYNSSFCRVSDRGQASLLNENEADKIRTEIVNSKLAVKVLIEEK